MSSVLFRINFLLYKLVKCVLYCFVPKNLRTYVLDFWCDVRSQQQQMQQQQLQEEEENVPLSPSASAVSQSPHVVPRGVDADELKMVFHMFDRDKDGMITKDELNDSLINMGIFVADKELTQMMEKTDVNGDGCIDMDEFQVLYQTITDMNDDDDNSNNMEADMKEAFDVFDQNGDGFITADELKLVLASLGLGRGRATMEDCDRMIERVDADGDGMVSFAEFKQMLRGGINVTSFVN